MKQVWGHVRAHLSAQLSARVRRACTTGVCAAIFAIGLVTIASAPLGVMESLSGHSVGGVVQSSSWGVAVAHAQEAQPAAGSVEADQAVYPPAPTATQQQPSFSGAFMNMLPLLLACMLIFHFMVLKPQEAKAKAHKELMESLKKGDDVVTSGGIIGKVASIDNAVVGLDVGPSVRIRVERAHIAKRVDLSAKATAAS